MIFEISVVVTKRDRFESLVSLTQCALQHLSGTKSVRCIQRRISYEKSNCCTISNLSGRYPVSLWPITQSTQHFRSTQRTSYR